MDADPYQNAKVQLGFSVGKEDDTPGTQPYVDSSLKPNRPPIKDTSSIPSSTPCPSPRTSVYRLQAQLEMMISLSFIVRIETPCRAPHSCMKILADKSMNEDEHLDDSKWSTTDEDIDVTYNTVITAKTLGFTPINYPAFPVLFTTSGFTPLYASATQFPFDTAPPASMHQRVVNEGGFPMGPFADSVPRGYGYVSEGDDDDEGADAKMSDDNSNPERMRRWWMKIFLLPLVIHPRVYLA